MRRSGRVVVIVGASRGMGRAAAYRFARRSARLVLVARDEAALLEAAAECRALGAQVLVIPGDVTVEGTAAEVVTRAVERFGRIDVWIGAVGALVYGRVEQTPTDVYRRVFETNVVAQVDGVRAVLPQLRAQGSGRIILIGSLFSVVTAPYASAYAASKFALLGFTRSLQQELLGSPGIEVRMVLPASIDTPIYQRASNFTGRAPRPLPPVTSPYRVARVIERSSRGLGPRVATVGRMQSSMILLARALPRVYDRVILVLVETLGLSRDPAPDSLGALQSAQPGPSTVTGGWRSPRRRAMLAASAALGAAALWGRRRRG